SDLAAKAPEVSPKTNTTIVAIVSGRLGPQTAFRLTVRVPTGIGVIAPPQEQCHGQPQLKSWRRHKLLWQSHLQANFSIKQNCLCVHERHTFLWVAAVIRAFS